MEVGFLIERMLVSNTPWKEWKLNGNLAGDSTNQAFICKEIWSFTKSGKPGNCYVGEINLSTFAD